MHAGVASQKLAMQVSQKLARRCLTLNEVPPNASMDCRQAPLLTDCVSSESFRCARAAREPFDQSRAGSHQDQ